MARVTSSELREIFETSLTDSQLDAFIRSANTVVNDNLTGTDCGFSSGTLREIELWLAAHFAAISDMREREVQIGEARLSYEGWGWEKGLNFTRYGMQVLVLDSCGKLANLGQKQATFRVSPRRGGRKDSVLGD